MFIILLLIVIAAIGLLIRSYNRLRGLSEAVKRSQSNLVGELRKRATLVNQLIDVCKGYGDHEKLTHLSVASSDAQNPTELAAATSTVLASVGSMANRFPDLKANETYNTLMSQLKEIEDNLQAKREMMNREVEEYNKVRSAFPTVLIAQQLGFPEAAYFSTDEAGLDQSQQFRTDDGELLKAQFARLGQGVSAATKQIGQRANAALQNAREQDGGTAAAAPAATEGDGDGIVAIVKPGETPEDEAPKS